MISWSLLVAMEVLLAMCALFVVFETLTALEAQNLEENTLIATINYRLIALEIVEMFGDFFMQ
jgi:hypothetical protein